MYVFVYGTLKDGHSNNGLMHRSTLIGEGLLDGYKMFSVHGSFPCIIPKDKSQVFGELWEVPMEDLPNLDRLEGYYSENEPMSMYLRRTGTIVNKEGEQVEASFYVWNGDTDGYPEVCSGRW